MLGKIFKKKSSKSNEVLYSEKPYNEELELSSRNINSILKKNSDAIFRDIFICGDHKRPVTLVLIDGLVDSKGIADDVVRPLIENIKLCEAKNVKETIDLIKHGAVYLPHMQVRDNINETLNDIFNACCALIFDSEKMFVILVGVFFLISILAGKDIEIGRLTPISHLDFLRLFF